MKMASSVASVLQRAAERSARRAELEVALLTVEKFLGHQLADDEFGWVSVLSRVLQGHGLIIIFLDNCIYYTLLGKRFELHFPI